MVAEAIDTAAPVTGDTAEPEVQAPPSVEAEEPTTPETAAPEPSETDPEPETPETESSPLSILDSLDEDALLAHPKVKDVLARRAESERRTREHAANEARAQADADWVQKREFVSDLESILKSGVGQDNDTGDLRVLLDEKKLEGFTERLNTTNVRGLVGAISNIVDSQLGKDFSLTPEESASIRDTYAEFQQNPRAKAPAYLQSILSVYGRSAVEAARADLTKEIEAKVRKEFETKAEAGKRQQAEATGRSAGSPTSVGGGAPSNHNLNTLKGLNAALRENAISEAQYNEGLGKL